MAWALSSYVRVGKLSGEGFRRTVGHSRSCFQRLLKKVEPWLEPKLKADALAVSAEYRLIMVLMPTQNGPASERPDRKRNRCSRFQLWSRRTALARQQCQRRR